MHASAAESLLPYLKPGATVLDIGSGSGYLTHVLAELVKPNGKVVGLDHIQGLVDLAKRLNVEEKVKMGHKRHALSASGFALLRQQAEAKEKENRHASVPVMRSAAIAV